jgi:hypothetical protein
MIRTIISLNEEDKAWLDRRAHEEGLTMTELVRRSVHLYRETTDPADSEFGVLLDETRNIWKAEDALQYQRRLREEWGS